MSFEVTEVSRSKEAAGKDFDWILNKAKENVEEGLGMKTGKQEALVANVKPPKNALDSVNLPKTLGDIPAAQAHDSDEFAHLARMNVVDREKALSKMSPDKLDQYLEST